MHFYAMEKLRAWGTMAIELQTVHNKFALLESWCVELRDFDSMNEGVSPVPSLKVLSFHGYGKLNALWCFKAW